MESTTVAGESGSLPIRKRHFAAFHRHDRNFFLVFVVVSWIAVIMGFAPASIARWNGHANFPAPPILHIHAVSFVGWMVLLTVQVVLIRRLKQRHHMTLGMAAAALLPIMLVSGFMAEQITQRFHFDRGEPNLPFFSVPLFNLVGLGVFGAAALLWRRKPATHKRLIFLATAVIVGVGFSRWWGDALYARYGDDFWGMILNTFLGLNLMLAAAIAYDWATRRQVHQVLAFGVPAILAGELATSAIYHSPGWLPIAQFLIGR